MGILTLYMANMSEVLSHISNICDISVRRSNLLSQED
jgi:hypothetical protein